MLGQFHIEIERPGVMVLFILVRRHAAINFQQGDGNGLDINIVIAGAEGEGEEAGFERLDLVAAGGCALGENNQAAARSDFL